MVITINKSPNADSRTAKGDVSYSDFCKATDMHRDDVKRVMDMLADMIQQSGSNHDWSKKERELEFYKSFTAAKKEGKSFKKDDWYKFHVTSERHHLLSRCPEDVNLIDVLEMISDCCCAGFARSGKVYDIEIPQDMLKKAFDNTVELVKKSIIVED